MKASKTFGAIGTVLFALASGNAGAFCFDEAAAPYSALGMTGNHLRAIARVESSFRPSQVNTSNKDGSEDVGLMMINSYHFPRLARRGITRDRLLSEPCTNVKVGAEILAGNIRQHGLTWRAIGAYNAKTEWKREVYVRKVWLALNGKNPHGKPEKTRATKVEAVTATPPPPSVVPRRLVVIEARGEGGEGRDDV